MKTLAISLIILLQACVHQPIAVLNVTNPELGRALSGELILGVPAKLDELPKKGLLTLTPKMESFAEDAVKSASDKADKAELLHKALMSSSGLGVRYSAFETGTAQEVFDSAKANCLGYTLLYVALARHLGLSAEVNQVTVPPSWNMNDKKSYFLMRHVNAKVVIRRSFGSLVRDVSSVSDLGDVVVDLEMSRFRASYPQESLDQQSVEALFYNNRAMELASQGDTKNAFLYLRRAIEANKKQSFIWSNLGSLYRKSGHLSLAETVYLHALSINHRDLTVLHNLAGLYVQLGDQEKAELYTRKVQHYRNANPYYLYQEAIRAKEVGDIEKAKSLIARALKKEASDDRLYLLSAELSEIDGDFRHADRMRKKAKSLQM
jgi:Tfp pilus assembly protein PilF